MNRNFLGQDTSMEQHIKNMNKLARDIIFKQL